MKFALHILKEVRSQAYCPPEIADRVQVVWMFIRNKAERISPIDFLQGKGWTVCFMELDIGSPSFTEKFLSTLITGECFLDTCTISLSLIHLQMARAVHKSVPPHNRVAESEEGSVHYHGFWKCTVALKGWNHFCRGLQGLEKHTAMQRREKS